MSAEEARRRYIDFIRIQAMDTSFIRREEEKRLMQEGMVRFNLGLEEARGLLLATANEQGYVLQRGAEEEMGQMMAMQAQRTRGRKMSRTEFSQMMEMYRAKSKGAMTDVEMQSRLKALMQKNEIRPKRAGWIIRTKRWYNSIPE
ncbi:MAG: hypothetical protein HOL85_12330 [Rhodospirillaceae bacterium]|nr:hypothetical protein [Rhodospirillaceae bacterium]MBT6139962.1 hypothetical protein [Rhodospirillaceae bacterium]